MKKINLRNLKNVPIKSRHVRWNWEPSSDNPEHARYHIIAVGDKNLPGILQIVTEQIQRIYPIMDEIDVEGKVKGSKFRFVYKRFETRVAPREIDWTKIGFPVVRDRKIYERKKGNIEDYVADLYGN